MTQCAQTIFGAFGSGASGSSIIRTRLLVPLGMPSHASGGETSSPSQVYLEGIWPFCLNAGEFRVVAMAALPHKVSRTIAKRMIANPQFRRRDKAYFIFVRTGQLRVSSPTLKATNSGPAHADPYDHPINSEIAAKNAVSR